MRARRAGGGIGIIDGDCVAGRKAADIDVETVLRAGVTGVPAVVLSDSAGAMAAAMPSSWLCACTSSWSRISR